MDLPTPFLPVNAGHLTGMEFEVDMLAEREIIAEAQIPRESTTSCGCRICSGLGAWLSMVRPGTHAPPSAKHLTHVAEHFSLSAVGDYAADVRIGFGFAQHDDAVDQVEPHVDMMFHHNQRLMVCSRTWRTACTSLTPSGS